MMPTCGTLFRTKNGRWLIYDLSGAVENPNSTAAFCGILGSSLYGQADTQKWHY